MSGRNGGHHHKDGGNSSKHSGNDSNNGRNGDKAGGSGRKNRDLNGRQRYDSGRGNGGRSCGKDFQYGYRSSKHRSKDGKLGGDNSQHSADSHRDGRFGYSSSGGRNQAGRHHNQHGRDRSKDGGSSQEDGGRRGKQDRRSPGKHGDRPTCTMSSTTISSFEIKKKSPAEPVVPMNKFAGKTRNARKHAKRRENRRKAFSLELYSTEFSPKIEGSLANKIKTLDRRAKAQFKTGLSHAQFADKQEKEFRAEGKRDVCPRREESRRMMEKSRQTVAEAIRVRQHLDNFKKGIRGEFPRQPDGEVVEAYLNKLMGFNKISNIFK